MTNIFKKAISEIISNEKIQAAELTNQEVAKKASIQELEIALVVILVDLSYADQNFTQDEHNEIISLLAKNFQFTPAKTKHLIGQAKLTIANLRGTENFAKLLCENLNEEQRKKVLDIIHSIIVADNTIDPFETYLEGKYQKLLGL